MRLTKKESERIIQDTNVYTEDAAHGMAAGRTYSIW